MNFIFFALAFIIIANLLRFRLNGIKFPVELYLIVIIYIILIIIPDIRNLNISFIKDYYFLSKIIFTSLSFFPFSIMFLLLSEKFFKTHQYKAITNLNRIMLFLQLIIFIFVLATFMIRHYLEQRLSIIPNIISVYIILVFLLSIFIFFSVYKSDKKLYYRLKFIYFYISFILSLMSVGLINFYGYNSKTEKLIVIIFSLSAFFVIYSYSGRLIRLLDLFKLGMSLFLFSFLLIDILFLVAFIFTTTNILNYILCIVLGSIIGFLFVEIAFKYYRRKLKIYNNLISILNKGKGREISIDILEYNSISKRYENKFISLGKESIIIEFLKVNGVLFAYETDAFFEGELLHEVNLFFMKTQTKCIVLNKKNIILSIDCSIDILFTQDIFLFICFLKNKFIYRFKGLSIDYNHDNPTLLTLRRTLNKYYNFESYSQKDITIYELNKGEEISSYFYYTKNSKQLFSYISASRKMDSASMSALLLQYYLAGFLSKKINPKKFSELSERLYKRLIANRVSVTTFSFFVEKEQRKIKFTNTGHFPVYMLVKNNSNLFLLDIDNQSLSNSHKKIRNIKCNERFYKKGDRLFIFSNSFLTLFFNVNEYISSINNGSLKDLKSKITKEIGFSSFVDYFILEIELP